MSIMMVRKVSSERDVKGDAEMMDPRTQFVVYQEQEKELMARIGWLQAARDNGQSKESGQSLFSAAEQWLKEKVFNSEKVIAGAFGHHGAA